MFIIPIFVTMINPAKLANISPLIPAGDRVEEAIAFYEDKLGFTTIHQEGTPLRMAIVQRDSVTIYLVKNSYQPQPEGISLRIQMENIEQLYTDFKAKGGETKEPDGQLETKPWGPKEFSVIDLAGTCLTFYEFPK